MLYYFNIYYTELKSYGIVKLKQILILLALNFFTLTAVYAEQQMSSPELAAQQFYKWYIDELIKNNEQSDNLDTLQFYIAAQTIVELKKWLNSDDDDEVLDADIFIQAQDIGDDWDIIRIVQRKIAQTDDGCHYVFVAFGADQKHVLKDCMVFEDRKWKIKTVILVD